MTKAVVLVVEGGVLTRISAVPMVEDAFGIGEHLRHAGESGKGVVAMAPLFAVGSREP